MIRFPLFVRLGLVLALGLLGLIGCVAVYDGYLAPEPSFEPVVETSALDGWTPPWSSGAEGVAPAASGDCAEMPRKWFVIGWDGADWDLVLPLVEAGRLPNLERLMRGGTYGTLHTIVPTLSPAVWTTVATGRTPGRHGITHFYDQKPRLERWLERARSFGHLERELFSNADRRSRAVWNELSDRGHRVMTIGYHNTFPVERVNGLMVSNYLVQDSVARAMDMQSSGAESSQLANSLVYPRRHLREVLDLQRQVERRALEQVQRFAELADDEVTDFVRRSRRLDPEGDQKPYFLVKALSFDTLIAEVADAFLERIDPDLAMVHFQGADWAAHRFYYYHDPELFAGMDWPPEVRARLESERPRYRGTVEAFYVYLDEWLGRLLRHRSRDTGVLLVSDHGFEPAPDPDISGGHDDAPPGIVVLHGPGIRRGHRLDGATVYDLLPTLMAGLRLPVALDLRGRVLRDAFCDAAWAASPHPTVASYGDGEPYVPRIHRPESVDREILEQLESLGYVN